MCIRDRDYIGNVKYQISPLSFYQVNPVQTERLYGTALEYAGLTGNEIVWDLYCGIGTISLFLAQKAKKVYGVEIVPQAIEAVSYTHLDVYKRQPSQWSAGWIPDWLTGPRRTHPWPPDGILRRQ